MRLSDLSNEQKQFIVQANKGRSILVEACIGSGKTTAIQALCNVLGNSKESRKQILYLTYNKLLKLDAKARIKAPNTDVTNYHGFAYRELLRNNIRVSMQECVTVYNRSNLRTRHYDVLILDEYQDIDQEISLMLEHIKGCNPNLQIIVVGDMAQKIYDNTKLDVAEFIDQFMPNGHLRMEFTQCFRLGPSHASMLGAIWGKQIVGVNDDCEVIEGMSFREVQSFLATRDPGEILCLGSNTGKRCEMLNKLEEQYPQKFNKYTVWSKISENDGEATEPTPGVAIFTTFDSCKGMERDICVVFDWDESYWGIRRQKPNTKYEILRNIFCVAASRGKRKIIFVQTETPLSPRTLMDDSGRPLDFEDVAIHSMFDFKFDEDIAAAFNTLELKNVGAPGAIIDVPTSDGLIDLSPCIGIYQEAAYFEDYDIDESISLFFEINHDRVDKFKGQRESWSIEQKVLYLTSLETSQNRYWQQVRLPFVTPEKWAEISARLNTLVTPDAHVQEKCEIPFMSGEDIVFEAKGFCDILEDDRVIELKFVSELAHKHYLQCASYMIAFNKPKGLLWNVRTNQMVEITIPNRGRFMDCVARAITKGRLKRYGAKLSGDKSKGNPKKQKTANQKAASATNKKSKETCRDKVLSFCKGNAAVSNAIVARAVYAIARNREFTPTDIERAFKAKKLDIPASKKYFAKYFWEYADMILKDDIH